jgi:hypothetical protein
MTIFAGEDCQVVTEERRRYLRHRLAKAQLTIERQQQSFRRSSNEAQCRTYTSGVIPLSRLGYRTYSCLRANCKSYQEGAFVVGKKALIANSNARQNTTQQTNHSFCAPFDVAPSLSSIVQNKLLPSQKDNLPSSSQSHQSDMASRSSESCRETASS